MEKYSFRTLIEEAWTNVFQNRLFWFFGICVAAPTVLQNFWVSKISTTLSPEQIWDTFSSSPVEKQWLWIGGAALLYSVSIFGKSNLIITLEHCTKKESSKKRLSVRDLLKNLYRFFCIDFFVSIFFIILIGILALPPMIALFLGHSTQSLIALSVLTFFPIALTTFLIRIFSLYYYLLSPLSLKEAFENAGKLLSRFFLPIVSFSFLFLAITFSFTFCLNLIMLSLGAFLETLNHKSELELFNTFLISTFFITAYTIFEQSLWLSFFKKIATPQKPKEGESVPVEDSVSIEKVSESPLP